MIVGLSLCSNLAVSCFCYLRLGAGSYFSSKKVDQVASVESRYTVRGTVRHAIMTILWHSSLRERPRPRPVDRVSHSDDQRDRVV